MPGQSRFNHTRRSNRQPTTMWTQICCRCRRSRDASGRNLLVNHTRRSNRQPTTMWTQICRRCRRSRDVSVGRQDLRLQVPAVPSRDRVNHTRRTNWHRRQCGHEFSVVAGEVVTTRAGNVYSYKCPHCKAKIESTSRDGQIDNRRRCGHKFAVAAGKVVRTQWASTKRKSGSTG